MGSPKHLKKMFSFMHSSRKNGTTDKPTTDKSTTGKSKIVESKTAKPATSKPTTTNPMATGNSTSVDSAVAPSSSSSSRNPTTAASSSGSGISVSSKSSQVPTPSPGSGPGSIKAKPQGLPKLPPFSGKASQAAEIIVEPSGNVRLMTPREMAKKIEAEEEAERVKREEAERAKLPRNLDTLPAKVFLKILAMAGIRTTTQCRRLNKRCRSMIDGDEHIQFCLNKAGRNVLLEMKKLDTLQWTSFHAMADQVRQKQCCVCGRSANRVYLLTCRRVCGTCIVKEPIFRPIELSEAARRFGLDRDAILSSVPHARQRRSAVEGCDRLVAVDMMSALAAGIAKHGSFQEMVAYEQNTRKAPDDASTFPFATIRPYEELLAKAMSDGTLLPKAPNMPSTNNFLFDTMMHDAGVTDLHKPPRPADDPLELLPGGKATSAGNEDPFEELLRSGTGTIRLRFVRKS